MRSIRWLAVVTGTLALVTACGGGSGVGPNSPPVPNFTPSSCTVSVACNFTDASTDDNNDITAWHWDFNDPTSADPTSEAQNPVHTFGTVGTYQVSLKVTDGGGEFNTKTSPVTVATAASTAPIASFTFDACPGGTCTFTSTSTDVGGNIVSYAWDFGEPASGADNTSTAANPAHTYAPVTQATTFTVRLTVTDNDNLTGVATNTVTIQPPAEQLCASSGTTSTCTLDLTQASTLTFTLVSRSCEIGGNKLEIRLPLPVKAVFFNGCSEPPNTQYVITDASGLPRVFPLGQVQVRFTRGEPNSGDPAAGTPGIKLVGSYPNWTMNIDDGGNFGRDGEPDFTDIVLRVTATRQ